MSASQIKFENAFEHIFKQNQYKLRKNKKEPLDLDDVQIIPDES